ncbi:SnoaL-like polyketide cyclase [Aliiruegeria haliotis]|uniref:SnoaL-like polyketide cyclase n=1 Tax=Aliiruegeria haliotis TaxID=1280846 RepID=A0A2T0RYJ2_9RHOB|nr:ester cyclase [Aliiruegeria haliotis]PRY26093.1 SnoaL-like polyketide cyclase [Aliiruegeria haliotis]
MSDVHTSNKAAIAPLRAAMYDFDAATVRAALEAILAADAVVHMCHPFGDLTGPGELYERCYAPLLASLPDLERRDYIVMAGVDDFGNDWVGCGGYYTGVFVAPWLDIPPTGHQLHMRFHEFYKFEAGRITEIQTLWDIPEVMIQANAWPMAPSLGREWHVPGPATLDGVVPGPWDRETSTASCQHIVTMLEYLKKHPSQGGPEVMEMERFWHERMNWYGPSGIGTGRGIAGFRNWHQIPFLSGMPDRGQFVDEIDYHFFGDGNYAAVTGWPNMIQTVTDDGWLGIAPSGKRITMRSLDFWRLENGRIRENWVMVDILDAYRQLGVDVFRRLREFNKARVQGTIPFPVGER